MYPPFPEQSRRRKLTTSQLEAFKVALGSEAQAMLETTSETELEDAANRVIDYLLFANGFESSGKKMTSRLKPPGSGPAI